MAALTVLLEYGKDILVECDALGGHCRGPDRATNSSQS
jgi:hypothetical protein